MTSKKTARGEKCHHGGKNGRGTRKDRGHLAKGCQKAEMCNFWVVEPVSCWDPHFTGISRLSHQKYSCTSHQRNITPTSNAIPGLPHPKSQNAAKKTFLLTSPKKYSFNARISSVSLQKIFCSPHKKSFDAYRNA